jgi:ABC-type Fe3+-hydroxamate transport system substrate-binding protein
VSRFHWILAVVLAALALGGCSDDAGVSSKKPRPLKVAHALGETRVPFHSKRPVMLDPSALETSLALGLTARGSTAWSRDGRFPDYLPAAARRVTRLGRPERVDLKQVVALNPDVIIGNKLYHQASLYRRLKRIAPTVMGGIPLSGWKSDVRFHGESLGRTDAAEKLLIDYDRRAARVRRALARTHPRSVRLPRSLAAELSPDFLANVLQDVGVRTSTPRASGRNGGILAARRVLEALRRGVR